MTLDAYITSLPDSDLDDEVQVIHVDKIPFENGSREFKLPEHAKAPGYRLLCLNSFSGILNSHSLNSFFKLS